MNDTAKLAELIAESSVNVWEFSSNPVYPAFGRRRVSTARASGVR
jgi:hypothetical protein